MKFLPDFLADFLNDFFNPPDPSEKWDPNCMRTVYGLYKDCLLPLIPIADPNNPSRISGWEFDKYDIEAFEKGEYYLPVPPIDITDDSASCSVCQEMDAHLYGDYEDVMCDLVPIVNPKYPHRIVRWYFDPDMVKAIHKRKGIPLPERQNSKTMSCKPDAQVVSKESVICIDGSNVIGVDDNLRTKVLKAIATALNNAGYDCRVFVDRTIFGWLRNKKHDAKGAKYLSDGEKKGQIIVAPNKAEADGQILQLAEFEKNAHIITNDHYRDYAKLHPWLNNSGAANRLHGINVVSMGNGKSRILIAGFNLDITVRA